MHDRRHYQPVLLLFLSLVFIFNVSAASIPGRRAPIVQMVMTDGDSSTVITKRFADPYRENRASSSLRQSTIFVVTSIADLPDDSIGDGVYFPQTLRAAIQNANETAEPDIIVFGPGITEIALQSALPPVDYPITISGIVLDGADITPQSGVGQFGLAFRDGAAGSSVDSVEIRNFPDAGLFIGARNVTVQKCTIHDNEGAGILGNAARACVIGGNSLTDQGNLIYDNTTSSGDGIQLFTDIIGNTSDSNRIEGNLIGSQDGITAAPNQRAGVHIWGYHNRIRNNLISGNNYAGIAIGDDIDFPSTGNVIDSNIIGLTVPVFGFAVLPNGLGNSGGGLAIRYGEFDTISNNYIGGNNGHGIEFSSSGNNAYISDNNIGVDTIANQPVGNNGNGMFLRGSFNLIEYNYVGGNITGVSIQGDNNTLRTNILGSFDSPDLSNAVSGVQIDGNDNVIGGPDPDYANACSGNALYGIAVSGAGSTNNLVQHNYVGVFGPFAFLPPNRGDGIIIVDSVQGTQVLDNIIVGNDSNGVHIRTSFGRRPRGTILERNIVGDIANAGLGNGRSGILIDGAVATTIGGFVIGSENDIRGNGLHGLEIRDADSTIVIGDTIADNGGHGIVIDAGLFNLMYENSIFDNGLLGIDLGGDGVTGNDTDDLDGGPNMLQNYPFISAIIQVNDTLLVTGELDGAPLTEYIIDMYRNTDCDMSGNGEGQVWVGSALVTSGVNGIALLDFRVAGTYDPTFSDFTFTATDPDGNTSEFTPCFELLLLTADMELTSVASSDTILVGDTVTIVMTVENNGPDLATGTTVIDSIPVKMTYVDDTTTQGSCSLANGVLTCLLGVIAPGANAAITLTLAADSAGPVSIGAVAAAAEPDPIPQNNASVVLLEVEDPATGVDPDGFDGLPAEYSLAQNYPNPFNPTTTIAFGLPERAQVSLEIFNTAGQRIRSLLVASLAAGKYSVVWGGRSDHGEPAASGVYFYRLTAGNVVVSRKMVLLK